MKNEIKDLEKNKFRPGGDGKSKIAITNEDGILSGITFDKVSASRPSPEIIVYSYYFKNELVAQVEVSYTDATKKEFVEAKRI